MTGKGRVLNSGICSLHLAEHICIAYDARNRPVEMALTPTEWAILELLLRHKGQLVRHKAFERVWGDRQGPMTPAMRHWHVSNLRKRIMAITGRDATPIQAVRGLGYKWQEEEHGDKVSALPEGN